MRDPSLRTAVECDDIFYPAENTVWATRSKSAVCRVLARAQPNVRPGELTWVSASEFWLQRMAVARNRNTPEYVIERLTNDSHNLVAAQAQETQKRAKRDKKVV